MAFAAPDGFRIIAPQASRSEAALAGTNLRHMKDRQQVRAVSGAPVAYAGGHGRRAAASLQEADPVPGGRVVCLVPILLQKSLNASASSDFAHCDAIRCGGGR
jgi:hypothetical protein